MTTKGRLTRQELGWLLTQEARGAAERLRRGVQVLSKTIPPPSDESPSIFDDTLNALDDAMGVLSSLHPRPLGSRGRRGRIDVAALLWEVAPDARVSIEPGSGTEVFGDEAELRRMLHVLVGPGSRAGSAIHVRRDGEEVFLQIELGPDSSATSDTERAWLSRMAIRYGGRYELQGGSETLVLPADDVAERERREADLRKELDEARRKGEAYARELAAVTGGAEIDTSTGTSTIPPPIMPAPDRFATIARIAGGIAAELRGLLSPVGWDLLALLDPRGAGAPRVEGASERLEAIQRRLMQVQDFVAELGLVGDLDPGEAHLDIDLGEVLRNAIRSASLRAERLGVHVALDAPGGEARLTVQAAPRAVDVLVRQLLAHAIVATPRGRAVQVTVRPRLGREGEGAELVFDDAGPSVPEADRRAYMALEVAPSTFGRPSSLALHLAASIADCLDATVTLDAAPRGGVRVIVTFDR